MSLVTLHVPSCQVELIQVLFHATVCVCVIQGGGRCAAMPIWMAARTSNGEFETGEQNSTGLRSPVGPEDANILAPGGCFL